MKKLLLLLSVPLVVQAAGPHVLNPGYEPKSGYVEDDATGPWKELAASLPPFPKDENLFEFNVSSATSNKFMIDTASISVGSDQVVRYTVVVESPRGARTINYEGMRCEPAEYKIYAFGQTDGKWTGNTRAKWEPFKTRSLLSYHKALFEDHFCPNELTIRDAKEGINNLKRGGSKGIF